MKLTTKTFGDDYYNNDVGFSRGPDIRLKKAIKKMASKARRADAKNDIRLRYKEV